MQQCKRENRSGSRIIAHVLNSKNNLKPHIHRLIMCRIIAHVLNSPQRAQISGDVLALTVRKITK